MRGTVRGWAPYAVGLIGTLLFVDLFLGWHRVSVSVAGNLIDVANDSSAWAGWGVLAGALLIVLLLWEGLRLVGATVAQRASAGLLSFLFAGGTAAFTTIEFVTGTVDVQTAGVVQVGVHGRQWPAYVGLVLAWLLVVAAVARLERPITQHTEHLRLGVR